MDFEKNNFWEKIFKSTGYLSTYIIFTVMAFFILSYLNKLPDDFYIYHMFGITLAILLLGNLIKRILQ